MERLSSVKMTVENCLWTINMCLSWISLTMVTLLIVIVVHLAYGGHFLQQASVSLLFMGVHLMGYG